MRVRALTKDLSLEVEYDGPIPQSIQTDPTRLRQILINLVGNAVKFTETGSVQLVVRLTAADGQPPKLQFDVIDTGIGMTAEDASAVFRPFTQADTSSSRRFGGTGLGLTISKRLAEMLGGDITLSSSPGKGSTLSLSVRTGPLDGVPMLSKPPETVRQPGKNVKTVTGPRLKLNYRVLLVEDGPDNRRLIAFLLKKGGADVTLAENGPQ